MKKLFSVILAMVMAASLFTGCVEKNDPENKVEPTPTPAATPGPVTDVDEDDPNYPTVLAMWKDMDGYWVNEDGEYLFFTLDDNGKAVLYSYDDGGVLDGFMKATAVMSSNKTSYYIAVDLPYHPAAGTPAFHQRPKRIRSQCRFCPCRAIYASGNQADNDV